MKTRVLSSELPALDPRRTVMAIVLVLVAAIAAAGIAFVAYGRAETWALFFGDPDLGPFNRFAPARSPYPNDALFCTPGLCDGVAVDATLPEYDQLPEILISRVDAAMLSLGVPLLRVDDGVNPARARYVTFTPLLRFPDTTSFEAVLLEDGRTGLIAYARSQIGRYDQGVNRTRLGKIAEKLAL